MVIKVGRGEYTIEFTFEASLYGECTEKVIAFMSAIPENGTADEIKHFITSLSDIPSTTLTMFYAGLMEHHGEDGDGTVTSKKDAKAILKAYIEENRDNEDGTFYAVMEKMIEQMGKDGFFDRIGLTKILSTEEPKKPKMPQDHKKKTTTTKKANVSVVGEK
jgi:CRISPR/Cas system CSM-associated protein Csm2 small subunit